MLKVLLREVSYCDSEEDLLDLATTIVDQHFELDRVPPFTSAETAKTARSAWRMEREDRNWVGTEAKIMIKASEFVVLQRNPDGFVLLAMLRWLHSVRPEPFAVSPKAMAKGEVIDGWTYPRRWTPGTGSSSKVS